MRKLEGIRNHVGLPAVLHEMPQRISLLQGIRQASAEMRSAGSDPAEAPRCVTDSGGTEAGVIVESLAPAGK